MEGIRFFFSSLFLADIDIGALLASDEGSTYNYFDQFMNMLFTLGIVLGLILVTLWALKKMMHSRNRHLNKSTTIQIIERRALSQKSSLYLIQVEEKKMVISDSPAGISLICDCAPEKEEFLEEEVLPVKPTFSTIIGNKLKELFAKNA